jgi:hypothetical protein
VSRRALGSVGSLGRAAPVLFLSMLVAATMAGCFSDRPTGPSGTTVSFANDVQPILTNNCASSGCHGTANANPTGKPMVLVAGQAYDAIVGVTSAQLATMQRIRPGQPDQSYLIHKLQGSHTGVGGSGQRMPLGRAALSQAQIDLIRRWVTEGARRN